MYKRVGDCDEMSSMLLADVGQRVKPSETRQHKAVTEA